MKAILFLFVVFCTCLGEDDNRAKEVANILNKSELKRYIHYLPTDLRRAISKRNGPDHWCCNDGGHHLRPIEKHESRITVMYRRVSTQVTNDFHSCGLWGLGRCEMTNAKYHQIVEYGERYLKKPEFTDCSTDIVCCQGYHLVAGNCIAYEHLKKHGDTVFALCKLGVVVCPGPSTPASGSSE